MSNASRERNAFLFGDDDEDGEGQAAGGGGGGGGKKSGLAMGPLGDGIFGLEVISRSKERQQEKDDGKEGDGAKGEERVEEER